MKPVLIPLISTCLIMLSCGPEAVDSRLVGTWRSAESDITVRESLGGL